MVLSQRNIVEFIDFAKNKTAISIFYNGQNKRANFLDTCSYQNNINQAFELREKYANEALDFFKLDTSKYIFIFKNCFLSFKVNANNAVVLGDPVGPSEEIYQAIKEFKMICRQYNLNLCFFQCSDRFLDIYLNLGFEKIKIGSEAIVDIEHFNLNGPKKKDFRNRIRKLESLGFFIKSYSENISDDLYIKLKSVSDQWLEEPNRIERSFSLGHFCRSYLEKSEIITVENQAGEVIAFVNLIYSFKDGQITIDLMRKTKEAPSGVMDYIFVKTILELQKRSYKSLNLGLAPMSGFNKNEKPSFAEITVHNVFQKLNFLFNYEGLKVFKKKFATSWDAKYLFFENLSQLPGIALSIKNILEDLSQ